MQEKDWKAALGSRRVLEGANLALYTAVVVAIVVVINVAVNRYFDRHWDLTPTKKYSLSPQSEKLLKALNRDVTIYVFDRERGRRQRDVTGMYLAASRRVTVRFVDPDRDPGLARKYGVRREGTTVVEAGDRHFEAQGEGEEGITNALVRVLSVGWPQGDRADGKPEDLSDRGEGPRHRTAADHDQLGPCGRTRDCLAGREGAYLHTNA